MARSGIRRIRLIRSEVDGSGRGRPDFSLLEIPRKWASAVASLIKLSDEYRHVGLLVTNVGPDSPAAVAGIARGDMLLRYDGVELDSTETLRRLASNLPQGGDTGRQSTLEALRGSEEMTFKVAGGRLGITTSPLLHRLDSFQQRQPQVIYIPDSAERPIPDESVLMSVPAALVSQVLFLQEIIQRPNNSKETKKVKALLSTGASIA